MTVIYEVNVFVEKEHFDSFMAFLKPHADEMLTFDGFLSYDVSLPEMDGDETGKIAICASYRVESRELLQKYFDGEASRMRADTMSKFEGKITANRRIMKSSFSRGN
jgi:quinol monooxygenase YgiN